MLFECENQSPIHDVSEKAVVDALKRLRSYGPSSFASLTRDDGSYVQVAGGKVTCMLEKRDMASGKHYRAHQDSPSTPFPDGTILSFSGGDISIKNDEWFNIDQVVEVFTAFLRNQDMPKFVKWRDVTSSRVPSSPLF